MSKSFRFFLQIEIKVHYKIIFCNHSAMDSVIEFQASCAILSDGEFDELLQSIYQHGGGKRRVMTKALFHLFVANGSHPSAQKDDLLHFSNESAKSIITNRKKKEEAMDESNSKKKTTKDKKHKSRKKSLFHSSSSIQKKDAEELNECDPRDDNNSNNQQIIAKPKMTSCPDGVIGYISSFLHIHSYQSLMLCSRKMFLALKNPIKLKWLRKEVFLRAANPRKPNFHHKLQSFRDLIHIGIDVNEFVEVDVPYQKPYLPFLSSLGLFNCNQISIEQLLDTNCWVWSNITKLSLTQYRINWSQGLNQIISGYVDQFMALMNRVPNLKILRLQDMTINSLSDS